MNTNQQSFTITGKRMIMHQHHVINVCHQIRVIHFGYISGCGFIQMYTRNLFVTLTKSLAAQLETDLQENRLDAEALVLVTKIRECWRNAPKASIRIVIQLSRIKVAQASMLDAELQFSILCYVSVRDYVRRACAPC